jgi:glucosylceramidase
LIFLNRFLKAYESHGVDMWGITVKNEPIEGQNPHQGINGMSLYPNQERDFVKLNLGPTLEKAGFNSSKVKVMIYDENTFNPRMIEWADTILSDKDAAKWVSGIAFHWYANNEHTGQTLDTMHEKFPQFFLLNTEACIIKPPIIGSWSWAERYAFDIIRVCISDLRIRIYSLIPTIFSFNKHFVLIF